MDACNHFCFLSCLMLLLVCWHCSTNTCTCAAWGYEKPSTVKTASDMMQGKVHAGGHGSAQSTLEGQVVSRLAVETAFSMMFDELHEILAVTLSQCHGKRPRRTSGVAGREPGLPTAVVNDTTTIGSSPGILRSGERKSRLDELLASLGSSEFSPNLTGRWATVQQQLQRIGSACNCSAEHPPSEEFPLPNQPHQASYTQQAYNSNGVFFNQHQSPSPQHFARPASSWTAPPETRAASMDGSPLSEVARVRFSGERPRAMASEVQDQGYDEGAPLRFPTTQTVRTSFASPTHSRR